MNEEIGSERLKCWLRAFTYFTVAHPTWSPKDRTELGERIGAWDDLCSDVATEDIVWAARELAREHVFQPTPGRLREIAIGRVVKVPVYATDVWGRTVLEAGGAPRTMYWQEVRVPHGGVPPSCLVDGQFQLGDVVDGCEVLERQQLKPAMQTSPSVMPERGEYPKLTSFTDCDFEVDA